MKREDLWPYQRQAVAAAVSNAVCGDGLALFLEPGDGKTVATLTALVDLAAFPALVVAPAQVVKADVWGREACAWRQLQGLQVVALAGTPAQRLSKSCQPFLPSVAVVSYENLLWLSDNFNLDDFQAVVFDELSKMKAPGTRRFRRLRARFDKIDFERAKAGRRPQLRLGLTGTPVGNHLLDLWGEMFMVAGAKALGRTFGEYKAQYFAPIDYNEYAWRLKCCPDCATKGKRGMECKAEWSTRCPCHGRQLADIKRRIAPFVFRRPAGTPSKSPPVRVNPIHVPMAPKHVKVTEDLLRQLFAEVGPGVTIEALQASALAGKIRQLAGGACYTNDEGGWVEVHNAKLEALDNFLDELQGEPVLVYYWYQHEAMRIGSRLKGRKWREAGGPGALDEWNEGKLEVLLAHPQSSGFGLNLQGGGHHVAWFALPWSGELWRQGNGRVARPGQKAPWVTATQFLCGPADERIAGVLEGKVTMEQVVMSGA